MKNSKVVSFLSPFKVGQAGNLMTLPRTLRTSAKHSVRELIDYTMYSQEISPDLISTDYDIVLSLHSTSLHCTFKNVSIYHSLQLLLAGFWHSIRPLYPSYMV